ncbi:Furin-like protease 1, isoforms 1/1-X/2 [Gryllus bimaculatus]|nr:Furin-like protease 1, isoforms 1/1-X/2 [Gryllus bimaculatus]
MWYLNRGHGLDMNVQPAWQQGVSGRGVVVTILDDGLEKDHPDLYRNYDPQASYDVNNHDEDPMPRYDLIDSNRHGTRCAGEVAATANNSICAVGVAFGASVGGVRMLDGDVTDAVEARSLSLNPQHIDIYSASWGPDDDGKTVDGPGELATRAFIEGVSKGRNGKGSIFVWASGNGGRDHDNCNYLHHQCTSSHTGTSASAPLAAGICALALESNRDLTWRDMQHIVVRTAKPANLRTSDWKTNGVGRNVSHSFGYGLMDASAMVRLARVWKSVPEQHKCEVSAPHSDKLIPAKSQVLLQLHVRECAGINYLEHVQAKISLASSRRGDLQIHLTSPAGTRTTLLARRPHDVSRAGFQNWPFMSVHTWGEKPFGIWILEIHNEGRFLGRATLQEWALIFYGTAENPYGNDIPNPAAPSHSPHANPSQSGSGKGTRPSRPRPAPSVFSSPYAVNSSPRKGKNRVHKTNGGKSASHHASSSANTGRPSAIEIRRPTMPTASRPRVRPTTKPTFPTTTPTTSETITITPVTKNITVTSTPLIEMVASVGNISAQQEVSTKAPSRASPTYPEYPIVQQLYPLYALSKLEGLSSGKGRVDPSSFRDSRVNLASSSGLDLLRPDSHRPGLIKGISLVVSSCMTTSCTLHDWKLVLYGTDTAPGINLQQETAPDLGDGESSLGPSSNEDLLPPVEPKEKILPKDEDIMHNDILRTTTENDALSSGCIALSKKGQDCIGLCLLVIALAYESGAFIQADLKCYSLTEFLCTYESCSKRKSVLVFHIVNENDSYDLAGSAYSV